MKTIIVLSSFFGVSAYLRSQEKAERSQFKVQSTQV